MIHEEMAGLSDMHIAPSASGDLSEGEEIQGPAKQAPVRHDGPKVGRNDPCPCGSGKKYKKCCGK